MPVSEASPTTQPATDRLNYVMRDYSKNEMEARLAGRERRLGYFNKVQQLRQAGLSISKISRQLAMNRSTVCRYAYAESFPERIRRPTGRSMLTPFWTTWKIAISRAVVTLNSCGENFVSRAIRVLTIR
ncbi:hypothetical protein GO755_25500 [Spirosoma sp. HMF4905]|uniref:Helix-turn-helix domain-containing protein n=1 Tax=Spirosoma arboris TaxID=2682092 RepID=A0A7K1SHX5_9BACT|nr:hypothetical protein [Spirosoma arboris]MVM33419.1 hypothetical protein [Spirosoma arboris]